MLEIAEHLLTRSSSQKGNSNRISLDKSSHYWLARQHITENKVRCMKKPSGICQITWCHIPEDSNYLTNSTERSPSWELMRFKLAKEFPAFYGIWQDGSLQCSWQPTTWGLTWVRRIQSTPFHHVSLRSISMLSSHIWLGLPRKLRIQWSNVTGYIILKAYSFSLKYININPTIY
jgi:hypothetical protein